MNRFTASCTDCGWISTGSKTQGLADYAFRLHSCNRWIARAESRARRIARSQEVDRTPKACSHKETRHEHGTHACYVLDACRCTPCSDANSVYERNRVRRNAYGRSDLIDAEPVRAHIRALMAAGIGLKQISSRAGIRGSGGITKLMYGIPGSRPPARRVRKATAARYLAVPIPQPDELAGGAFIASLGARRRLKALACIGWSIAAIAARYGLDRQRLDRAMRGETITVATHEAIARAFTDLWDTPAPETSHREKLSASRTRNRAKTAGWVPPLAWDDIDTDDEPNRSDETGGLDDIAIEELIAGRRCITGDAERRAAALILAAQGLGPTAIATRVGVTDRTINRWQKEAAA